MKKTFLMAPAGSFESLSAALKNGADAVYFGVGNLNMRARGAVNFQPEDLSAISEQCKKYGAQAWLTLNTVVFDSERDEVLKLCSEAKMRGIDAIIACDPAVIMTARKCGLSVHLSVQANVSNLEAVKFWAQYADAMVLARELNLTQIAGIVRGIEQENVRGPSGELVKIELFAHGALCIAYSGKCYMSLGLMNESANRGACLQPCRRAYVLKDESSGAEIALDNQYVMSPKDLCTICALERMVKAGVAIYKIEGRGRSADYTAAVTSVYRQALDKLNAGLPLSSEFQQAAVEKLERVFNRGFWHGGYYLGEKSETMWSAFSGNKATVKKCAIGKITHFFSKAEIAEFTVYSDCVRSGETLLATGPATGAVEFTADSMRVNDKPAEMAVQGDIVTVRIAGLKVRENDKLFVLRKDENII